MTSYSLQVERELLRNTVLIAGYQGSHGVHLFSPDIDINNDPITGVTLYAGFNGTQAGRMMLLNRTGSSSTYNAFAVQLNRRFYQGLQVNFNYTFSKSIDDSSGGIQFDYANLAGQDSSGLAIRIAQVQNSGGRTNERAVSSFNTPHVINLTGFWEVPVGRGHRFLNHGGLIDLLLGGYELSWLSRIQTGLPLFTNLGNNNNISLTSNTGLSNPRPNLAPGVPLVNPDWTKENATCTPYLNLRAFLVPEPGTFGNASRDYAVYSPWRRTFDFSVFKDIHPFRDSRKAIQLRAEFFNVLNMKNWGLTSGTQTAMFSNLNQNKAGQPNRYAALTPTVWNAILRKDSSGLSGAAASATSAGQS